MDALSTFWPRRAYSGSWDDRGITIATRNRRVTCALRARAIGERAQPHAPPSATALDAGVQSTRQRSGTLLVTQRRYLDEQRGT